MDAHELALRMRRLAVSDERLRRENQRAKTMEQEVIRERRMRSDTEKEEQEEKERREAADEFERQLFAEREMVLMRARARRLEAEEANRLGDEAVWKYNLELRRRNLSTDDERRQARRLKKHEQERQRIEPFKQMQRAAHDGKVDNAALSGGDNWVPPKIEFARVESYAPVSAPEWAK